MRSLEEYIHESSQEADEQVFVVKGDDGTMFNYFATEKEAKEAMDKLNKENPDNKATISKAKKSEFEK